MRAANGEVLRNAHLLGFFRRICKYDPEAFWQTHIMLFKLLPRSFTLLFLIQLWILIQRRAGVSTGLHESKTTMLNPDDAFMLHLSSSAENKHTDSIVTACFAIASRLNKSQGWQVHQVR